MFFLSPESFEYNEFWIQIDGTKPMAQSLDGTKSGQTHMNINIYKIDVR